MSLRYLSTRIELTFWQFIITLLSESGVVQHFVRWTYQDFIPQTKTISMRIDWKRAILWASAGLGLGLLTGILISFL